MMAEATAERPHQGRTKSLWILLATLGQSVAATNSDVTTSHDVCIIGAGPGGLQLGHLLLEAGRDHVIFEKAASAGSFFERNPVHRRLISLNKRFTVGGLN
jgi:NADPH-dependent 2,4-dienoyl-CoA reductase/sulfur reductase-like enzyme